jgi:hypothetical protein
LAASVDAPEGPSDEYGTLIHPPSSRRKVDNLRQHVRRELRYLTPLCRRMLPVIHHSLFNIHHSSGIPSAAPPWTPARRWNGYIWNARGRA